MDSGNVARSDEISHRMWLHHNKLAFIAPPQLVDPLQELARALHAAYWDGWSAGQQAWAHLRSPLARFNEAARNEMTPVR